MSLMKVVFPAPLWPTSARLWPSGMKRLRFFNAQRSCPGYRKPTFSNRMPFSAAGDVRAGAAPSEAAGVFGEEPAAAGSDAGDDDDDVGMARYWYRFDM